MTLDDTIGYMLGRIARKIHYRVDGVFKEYGITVEQWVALKTIAEYEPLCQKALAERIEKTRTRSRRSSRIWRTRAASTARPTRATCAT